MKGQAPKEDPPVGADPQEIVLLKHHVAEIAELALGMVADGTRALLTADTHLRDSVLARDPVLDRYDLNIEMEGVRAAAIHQPEGRDLRTLEAALKIATCYDRIGRLGYDLARSVTTTQATTAETDAILRQMDERARSMARQAMHAFLANDAEEAHAVFPLDDEVDRLCRQVQARIIELMRAGGPAVERLAYELLASRHLERVADNACKVAEKTVYAITGERRSEYFPPRLMS